jgi:hypothetical protein
MNSAVTQEQEPLAAQRPLTDQIGAAQGQIGGLERDLSTIDAELGRLAEQVEKFALLEQTFGSLERLDALGATELFWGKDAPRDSAAHLADIRRRIDDFRAEVKSCEDRRHAVVEQIDQGREVLGILEEDLFDLQLEEEERRSEWVIERDVGEFPDRPAKMPWTGDEDDRHFRKSLAASLLWALLFGLVIPQIGLPLPEPIEELEVPDRVVELIRQQRNRPATPPPAVMAERQPVEPEPIPEPEPTPEAEPEPVLAEELLVEDAPPEPAPGPPQPTARERAAASGLLAFRESFSTLADAGPAARLGSEARISRAGDAAVGQTVRAMVTTQAPGSSGGINLGSISRNVVAGGDGAGGGLAGVATSRVESAIGPGGGGGRLGGGGNGDGSGAQAGRTDEEIQIVFDRYKASLYRLYNRELRNDPTLRGQMVLHLTIEPDGSVSMCELRSTDMNAPALVEQVLARVRTFDFGAKDVAAITIIYPIDFLPAA